MSGPGHTPGICLIAGIAPVQVDHEQLRLLITMRAAIKHAVIFFEHIRRFRIGQIKAVFICTLPSHRNSPFHVLELEYCAQTNWQSIADQYRAFAKGENIKAAVKRLYI